jgi:hypothetical protein
MAANGISNHLPKSERKALKLAVAQAKRQATGTTGYRLYNVYTPPGTKSPTTGHPWTKT